MDPLENLAASVRTLPQLVASPQQPVYWGYLLAAFALAALLYLLRDARGPRSLGSFLAFAFPRRIWMQRSTHVDCRYLIVNATAGATLIAPMMIWSPIMAFETAGALERVFGSSGPALPALPAAQVFLALAILVAADLTFFLSHRLFHRVGLLWEFHKVHHSAEVLTPLTALRFHPVELLVTQSLQGVATGLVIGVFDYGFAYRLEPAGIFGANLFSFLFFSAGASLQHSHIWLSFGPRLSKIFVSPVQHQIHHSSDPRHHGRNFGAVFAVWDWLAGSLYLPRQRESLRVGLGGGEERAYQGVLRLYFVPFVRAGRALFSPDEMIARIPAGAGACRHVGGGPGTETH